MTILKRTGLVLLALITLLALWIAVNSIDDAELSPLAKEMLKPFPEVPPEENGYELIRYMSDENFEPPYDVESEKVLGNLRGKEWDPEFVKTITEKNQVAIADLTKATLKPRFKFPESKNAVDLPYYQNYIRIVRVLLLQTKLDVYHSEFGASLNKFDTAVNFCEQIMTEENHYMISYVLGASCLSDVFRVAHEISSNYKLDNQMRANLAKKALLNTPYQQDGFDRTFYGEITFLMAIAQDAQAKTLTERLHTVTELTTDWGIQTNIIFFLYTLFPGYQFPPNHTASKYASIYLEASKSTGLFCKDNHLIPSGPPGASDTQSVWGLLLPERLMPPRWTYGDYFERRCLAHTYFDAVRTIIAIHAYQQDHHTLPAKLNDLVPAYIDKLPIDYFDGKPLRYSAENKWLYSVGTDFIDDHGSVNGLNTNLCRDTKDKKACYANPTFPINWNDYPVELR